MNTYPSEQRSCESLEDVILRRPTTACMQEWQTADSTVMPDAAFFGVKLADC